MVLTIFSSRNGSASLASPVAAIIPRGGGGVVTPLEGSPLGQNREATMGHVPSRRLLLRTSAGLGLVQLLAACSPTPPATPTATVVPKPAAAPTSAAPAAPTSAAAPTSVPTSAAAAPTSAAPATIAAQPKGVALGKLPAFIP